MLNGSVCLQGSGQLADSRTWNIEYILAVDLRPFIEANAERAELNSRFVVVGYRDLQRELDRQHRKPDFSVALNFNEALTSHELV
jgi:hypothetical protein